MAVVLTLQYDVRLDSPGCIVGDGPALHNVSTVTVGAYGVSVRGQMILRDGTHSRRTRYVGVDTASPQPPWLEDILADAADRLAYPVAGSNKRKKVR